MKYTVEYIDVTQFQSQLLTYVQVQKVNEMQDKMGRLVTYTKLSPKLPN